MPNWISLTHPILISTFIRGKVRHCKLTSYLPGWVKVHYTFLPDSNKSCSKVCGRGCSATCIHLGYYSNRKTQLERTKYKVSYVINIDNVELSFSIRGRQLYAQDTGNVGGKEVSNMQPIV